MTGEMAKEQAERFVDVVVALGLRLETQIEDGLFDDSDEARALCLEAGQFWKYLEFASLPACAVCGLRFDPGQEGQQYCSAQCSVLAMELKHNIRLSPDCWMAAKAMDQEI